MRGAKVVSGVVVTTALRQDDRIKALSPAHRRELAQEAASGHGCSQRQICRAFGLHRSTYRYQAKRPSDARQQAEQAVVELSLVDEYTRETHEL